MPGLLVLVSLFIAGTSYAIGSSNDIHKLIESSLERSNLESQDCLQIYGLEGERYACGFLRVPEDYTDKASALIKVPFLLIYPDNDLFDPTLMPLLVTGGGGPGNAILGNQYFPLDENSFWAYEEFSVADARVLMILENRGVGLSQPNLDCHYSPAIFQHQFWSELLESDLICGSSYISKGIDLSQYNVHNAALDIEVFRQLSGNGGLDTSQFNLYGISYGTRIAMYYERMFPHYTRSMVLDSVSLNNPNSSADDLAYAQRSLDLVFSKCQSDTRCRETFGAELESEFYKFMDGVDTRNITLPVRWPGQLLPISIPLSASLVIDIVHNMLYSSDSFAAIPLTVRKMIDGSYTDLILVLNEYIESYSSRYTFSDTAFLTYLCIDMDYSTNRKNGFSGLKLFKYWDLERGREYMSKVCSSYEAMAETDLLLQPFTSDTPTLFLSGELDPVTPPASAAKAAVMYNYHWNITRNNASHDVISHSACARFLASWFVYHPHEDLDSRMQDCEPQEDFQFLLE